MKKDIIIVALLLILGFFAWTTFNSVTNNNKNKDLIESLNANLVTWKDKDSLNHARITTIQTNSTKEFLRLKTKDSTIIELQKSVNEFKKYIKKGGSVTNITNVTEVHNHSATEVSFDKDSVPIYKSDFDYDGWIYGQVEARSDTTILSLKYKNSFTVVIGEEKVNMFNRHRFVEVKDNNPYSGTPQVRTYEKKLSKVKRFGIGPYIGYGVGTNLKPQANIGIGLQFNLIQF